MSVTLEATGLRPAAFWPWLCRALWKQCGWVSSSALSGSVSKLFHHLVLKKMYAFVLKFVLNFKVTTFLFVCLFPVVAESKEQVFQSPTVVSLEGAVAEISCNHSISDVYDFLWYLHFPGFAPGLLIKGSKPSQQGCYNMTYERFSSSLLILQVQPADAGVYYCALRCTEAGHP